jgi:murein DD-endopeptidase MepM/ murein hydrolase activator NlpD
VLFVLPLLATAVAALPPHRVSDTLVLRSGQTLAELLYSAGLPSTEVQATLDSLVGVVNFSKLRAGDGVRIERDADAPSQRLSLLEIRDGPALEWVVRREGEKLVSSKRDIPITKRTIEVNAVLNSNLSQAFVDSGQDPQLALAVSDVFAWDIDFYLDPREGDRIHAVVERMEADGRLIGYGDVLAAEYEGGRQSTLGDKTVFRYVDRTGQPSYYDAAGQSARRSFLKSPLKFARISSGYGLRMHPVLHYVKEHQGVDYVAPTGTPVWAVGDGVVEAAGNKGANGNYVAIRHANGLETFYCHLSAFGAGIRAGERVLQKRVIGLVGMTGRATGPHLHFALKKAGSFMNPLALKVPRADPVPTAELPDFQAAIAPLMDALHGAILPSSTAASVAER